MTTPGSPPTAIRSAATGAAIAWSWSPTTATSCSSARTRRGGRPSSRPSAWPPTRRTSTGSWRSRAPSPTASARGWANTCCASSRTAPCWPSPGTSPGCWPLTPATAWRGSRPPATRRRWPPCAGRWKRRWASGSRASAARPSSAPPWCKRSSTASSPPGCSGRGRRRRPRARSTGARPSGTCARRCCGRCSSSFPIPAACNPLAWSRCSTGPTPRSTGWTRPPSSPASTKARRCLTSTSRSCKPSTPTCARNWAFGTRPRRWCATWWRGWTARSGTTWASPTGWRRTTSTCSIPAAAPAPTWRKSCAASPPTCETAVSAR